MRIVETAGDVRMTSKRGGTQPGGAKPGRTTISFSVPVAANLVELAGRRGMSAEELYVSLGFDATVRKLLIEENRKRLKELENQKPE